MTRAEDLIDAVAIIARALNASWYDDAERHNDLRRFIVDILAHDNAAEVMTMLALIATQAGLSAISRRGFFTEPEDSVVQVCMTEHERN